MSDAWNGIPPGDAARRYGWHWLHSPQPEPVEWSAASWSWWLGRAVTPALMARSDYLGPCLTPAEVAAAVAQARREALEEAAELADGWLTLFADHKPAHISPQKWARDAVLDIAAAIRALAAGGARDE